MQVLSGDLFASAAVSPVNFLAAAFAAYRSGLERARLGSHSLEAFGADKPPLAAGIPQHFKPRFDRLRRQCGYLSSGGGFGKECVDGHLSAHPLAFAAGDLRDRLRVFDGGWFTGHRVRPGLA